VAEGTARGLRWMTERGRQPLAMKSWRWRW